jgi:zinc/manganese transport system substrate-binding protein
MRSSLHRAAALLALAWAALASSAAAHAQTVFACEPEWAALVRTLLPTARVFVATHAGQDPHHIEARPSLIAQMRAADAVVCTGAELESGWLPVLQQRAGNSRARHPFFAADHVELIDARPGALATPWSGDVHAHGNPHLHADPHRVAAVAAALAQWLAAAFPAQSAAIMQRHAAFALRWRAALAEWERRAAPLRGLRVAAQHTTFAYLWRWLGVEQVADLEPRPGMAPTPAHLDRVLNALRAAPPAVIVVASYQDPRAARWLAAQLAAGGHVVPLRVLPATVAEDADAAALHDWFDGLVNTLLEARRETAPPR